MNLTTNEDMQASSRAATRTTAIDAIAYTIVDADIGKILVARSRHGVCSILIGKADQELEADLAGRFPASKRLRIDDVAKDDAFRVLNYIQRPARGLDLELDMRGTPFQRSVWQALRRIKAGETTTYAALVSSMTPPSHPRAVASACAANPIALAIPCHRVVRSDGDLAGYRWGIERKRTLIQRETLA